MVLGPQKMLIVPPRHYCVISNPVIRIPHDEEELANRNKKAGKAEESQVQNAVEDWDERGVVVMDDKGQAKLKHGDTQIIFERSEPFALYPGELLLTNMTALTVIEANTALSLRATRDFVDKFADYGKDTPRKAGDEWMFLGPATYMPQVEVEVVGTIKAVTVKPNQALKLRAKRGCVDKDGVHRKAGEQWMVRKDGSYLPGLYEEIVSVEKAIVLTEKTALQLKATHTFVDVFGKARKAGEEWLVTHNDREIHIPDVYERVVGQVALTSLTKREYCVVVNPVQDGVPQLGQKKVVKGEANFFLQPGEYLDNIGSAATIRCAFVLGEEEALLVRCVHTFDDTSTGKKINRRAGEQWAIYGPKEYVPDLAVEVLGRRKAQFQIESMHLYFGYWAALPIYNS